MKRRRDEARALFRNAILEAAEQVFAEKGFHDARIQDVAARARIAVGTVYNHFEHKEELLRALLEERTEALLAELEPRDGDPSDYEARLRARVARMLAHVDRHRSFYAIALEHGLIGGWSVGASSAIGKRRVRQVERLRAQWRGMVDEGLASGALEEAPPERVMRFLMSVVRGFMLASLPDPATRLGDQAAIVVDLFLHGAARRARPTRAPRNAG